MASPIKAKLSYGKHRVPLSGPAVIGQYDDNVIRLTLKIIEGPQAMLDRRVTLDVGIDDFVDSLVPEVRERLRRRLIEGGPLGQGTGNTAS